VLAGEIKVSLGDLVPWISPYHVCFYFDETACHFKLYNFIPEGSVLFSCSLSEKLGSICIISDDEQCVLVEETDFNPISSTTNLNSHVPFIGCYPDTFTCTENEDRITELSGS
jgi:hypothetical protein